LAQRLLDQPPETSDSHLRQAFIDALARARKAPPAAKSGVVELTCDAPWLCELSTPGQGTLELRLDRGL
jgi:hypothetical protein